MYDDERQEHFERARTLLDEQSFIAALIAGAVATVLAAAAYGIIVSLWPISYGFAAAGIGIVVGLSMVFVGRGITTKFSVAAALYTIVGCALGNLFMVIARLMRSTSTSPVDILRSHSLETLVERSMSNFDFIQLVFWFVAVVCGVFLAKRPLSRADRLALGLYRDAGG